MQNILSLINKYSALGVGFSINQETGRLKIKQPDGGLTDQQKEELGHHKEEILSFIQQSKAAAYLKDWLTESEQQWHQSFQDLIARTKPKHIPQARWDKILTWCQTFLNTPSYITKLAQYEWKLVDIFGCHKTNPEGGHLQSGFLLIVTSPLDERSQGLTIEEIQDDRIVLLREDGYYRNYFKQSSQIPNQATLMEAF